jgi:hypothetical protein
MSNLARVLALGVMLAAMNLVGMTTVAQGQTTTDNAVELFRRGERASQEQTTATDAVELFRRGERASQEQTTADPALQRVLAQEHSYNFGGTPAEVTSPVRPAEPSGQPDPLVVALGVLAAALALVGALAVMTARRASRRVRPRQAA